MRRVRTRTCDQCGACLSDDEAATIREVGVYDDQVVCDVCLTADTEEDWMGLDDEADRDEDQED